MRWRTMTDEAGVATVEWSRVGEYEDIRFEYSGDGVA
jgi:hypothetical protein